MKKLVFLLLLAANSAFAQNLGFNGEGFFENYNAQVGEWLKDMHQPFTIRVPGGSISKFHDPYNVRRGWGMTEQNIRDWFASSGYDEDGQGLDKWLTKEKQQPDHSYMDDLITLQKQFPDMQVIYVLNVLNSTPDANMQAIRYMKQNGVNIVAVEAGNEVYGKYSSFDDYEKDFEPIFSMLSKEYPDIKKGLVAGANLTRKELVSWNDALSKYKGNYDAVILHFYYTSRDIGDAYDLIPERASSYDPNNLNKDLDNAYRKAYDEIMSKNLFENLISYAKKQFPGKAIWITEWNTKPSEELNNTMANAAWQFREMVTLRDQCQYLLMHNGVSPDKYGMICRKTKFDSESDPMLRRLGYWAYILGSEVQNGIALEKGKKYTLQTDASGNVFYYFENMDDAYNADISYGNIKVKSATIHYLQGKYIYSSAGAAGYMGKTQSPNYEIKGITTEDYKGSIPKNAFGYIEFTLQK